MYPYPLGKGRLALLQWLPGVQEHLLYQVMVPILYMESSRVHPLVGVEEEGEGDPVESSRTGSYSGGFACTNGTTGTTSCTVLLACVGSGNSVLDGGLDGQGVPTTATTCGVGTVCTAYPAGIGMAES